MSKFLRAPVALSIVLALVAGACSSDDDSTSAGDSGSGGTLAVEADEMTEGGAWEAPGIEISADDLECGTAAEDPERGITDDSVRVGGLVTASGPTTALYGDTAAGAQARFERANAEGGVHGRTIDYVGTEDDGLEPSRQVDAARRLVEEEVFAVVPLGSTVPAWTDVFCEAVVPAFGWGTTPAWCNTTIGFGITGCLVNSDLTYNSLGIGPFVELLEGTDNTVAMIGIDSENARLGMTRFTETFERAGVEVVYAENILSAAEPIVDPSPVVNEIMTSNDGGPPAMVYQVIDFANTSAITQGLVAAGFEGKLVNAVGYDPRLAGFEGFEGSFTTLQWAPFESTDVEFVEQMNADFDEYAPELNRGLPSAAGYIAADMFLTALQDAGPDLSVDSFLETLNGGWTYSTPAFRGETRYPENHVLGVPCSNVVQLQAGEFSAVTPIICGQPYAREGA
jgi:ABC-type branched-subunit amino acid transport system substrate-binding protein